MYSVRTLNSFWMSLPFSLASQEVSNLLSLSQCWGWKTTELKLLPDTARQRDSSFGCPPALLNLPPGLAQYCSLSGFAKQAACMAHIDLLCEITFVACCVLSTNNCVGLLSLGMAKHSPVTVKVNGCKVLSTVQVSSKRGFFKCGIRNKVPMNFRPNI